MRRARAVEVAQNRSVRFDISGVARAIQDVTETVYIGRQTALKNHGYISTPFPVAWAFRERLLSLMQGYVLQQVEIPWAEWEAGWASTVIPQIRALE